MLTSFQSISSEPVLRFRAEAWLHFTELYSSLMTYSLVTGTISDPKSASVTKRNNEANLLT